MSIRKNVALINYYARLIKKDQWKIEDVPEDKKADVLAALEKLNAAETEVEQ